MPTRLPPFLAPSLLAAIGGVGDLPDLGRDLGVEPQEQDPRGVLKFVGGETAALARVKDYIWTKVSIRNGVSTCLGEHVSVCPVGCCCFFVR